MSERIPAYRILHLRPRAEEVDVGQRLERRMDPEVNDHATSGYGVLYIKSPPPPT